MRASSLIVEKTLKIAGCESLYALSLSSSSAQRLVYFAHLPMISRLELLPVISVGVPQSRRRLTGPCAFVWQKIFSDSILATLDKFFKSTYAISARR